MSNNENTKIITENLTTDTITRQKNKQYIINDIAYIFVGYSHCDKTKIPRFINVEQTNRIKDGNIDKLFTVSGAINPQILDVFLQEREINKNMEHDVSCLLQTNS